MLETEFDSERIHLTEKICRALACAHPFILAAGPMSLKLLKHYGFKTFTPWIDESYDYEFDSYARLQKIVAEMQRLSKLSSDDFAKVLTNLQAVAKFNQKRFFSIEFSKQIKDELQLNLNAAVNLAYKTKGHNFLQHKRFLLKQTTLASKEFAKSRHPYQVVKTMALRKLRQQT